MYNNRDDLWQILIDKSVRSYSTVEDASLAREYHKDGMVIYIEEDNRFYLVRGSFGSITYFPLEEAMDENTRLKKENSFLSYDSDADYTASNIVMYDNSIYKKITNEQNVGLPSDDPDHWELLISYEINNNTYPQIVKATHRATPYYDGFQVVDPDYVSIDLEIQNPSSNLADGSRIRFVTPEGFYYNNSVIFDDATFSGFNYFSHALAIDPALDLVEIQYSVSQDVIEDEKGYVTIGVEGSTYPVGKIQLRSNNGHLTEAPVVSSHLPIREGTVIESGAIYYLDSETPWGYDDIKAYYDNTGNIVNWLDKEVKSFKARTGSSGTIVGSDVKTIGRDVFGGNFPPLITPITAGLSLKSGELYAIYDGITPLAGIDITSWFTPTFGGEIIKSDYNKAVYMANSNFQIPHDVKNVLSVTELGYQPQTGQFGIMENWDLDQTPQPWPLWVSYLVPEAEIKFGYPVAYSQNSIIGKYTGSIQNYFGNDYSDAVFIWYTEDITLGYEDIRDHSKSIFTIGNGPPPISYIHELQIGMWISKDEYYTIPAGILYPEGDITNIGGIDYTDRIYKATSSGFLRSWNNDDSTVLGTSMTFEPAYGNTEEFPFTYTLPEISILTEDYYIEDPASTPDAEFTIEIKTKGIPLIKDITIYLEMEHRSLPFNLPAGSTSVDLAIPYEDLIFVSNNGIGNCKISLLTSGYYVVGTDTEINIKVESAPVINWDLSRFNEFNITTPLIGPKTPEPSYNLNIPLILSKPISEDIIVPCKITHQYYSSSRNIIDTTVEIKAGNTTGTIQHNILPDLEDHIIKFNIEPNPAYHLGSNVEYSLPYHGYRVLTIDGLSFINAYNSDSDGNLTSEGTCTFTVVASRPIDIPYEFGVEFITEGTSEEIRYVTLQAGSTEILIVKQHTLQYPGLTRYHLEPALSDEFVVASNEYQFHRPPLQ